MTQKEIIANKILDKVVENPISPGLSHNAYHVAEYLLNSSHILLTPFQLNKLVFLSHGWYLGIEHKALINEKVEAWQYGPIIPSIYQTYKLFGKGVIEPDEHYHSQFDVSFDTDTTNIMDQVIDIYGDYSGNQLIKLTKGAGSPWQEHYDPDNWATVILDKTIQKYYQLQYDAERREDLFDNP